MPKFNFIFAALSLLLVSAPLLAGVPNFPPPPQASVQWVGKDINVNGIQSAVRMFRTDRPIEKVVKFYRRKWERPPERDVPGFMETIDGYPWYVISRVEDGYLLTVQVRVDENDESSSWGYLSTSPLPSGKAPKEIGKKTPKMPGSHVLSEMKSNDPDKKAITSIVTNTHSVESNVAFYRNHYKGKGWTMETDQSIGTNKMHSLVFKSRRNRVTMMFIKDTNATRIVINSVSNSIL